MWIVGLIAIAIGVVWVLQGRGTLRGSFMTDSRVWLRIGIGAIVIGFALIAWSILLP